MWLGLLPLNREFQGRHGWCVLFVLLVFAGISTFNTHTQREHHKEKDKKYLTGTLQVPADYCGMKVPKLLPVPAPGMAFHLGT